MTYEEVNLVVNRVVTTRDREWCGIPMPLPGCGLVVEDRNPWKDRLAELHRIVNPPKPAAAMTGADVDEFVGWKEVNRWHSPEAHGTVLVMEKPNGSRLALIDHDAPKRNRLMFGPFETFDAWNLETELTAIDALAGLISEKMYKSYVLTGAFLETSKRSGLTYLFRRLRPTVVFTPRGSRRDAMFGQEPDGNMRILCCLCLHPIGYYENTYCGAMTPTDDVIAHLMLMRGDEPLFWRRANQHPPTVPQSGLS